MGSLNVGPISIQTPDSITVGSGGNIALPGNLGRASGNDAHIAAQNQAGADLASIVNRYNQTKAAGGNTTSVVQGLVNEVNTAVGRFRAVVQMVNTDRARRGLGEIESLANQVIASMVTTTGQVVAPTGPVTGGGGIGGAISNLLGGGDTTTLLLVAGAAYFLLKRR